MEIVTDKETIHKCIKKSLVIPLHKIGDLRAISNYQLISLISQTAKIIKKLATIQLQHFLK